MKTENGTTQRIDDHVLAVVRSAGEEICDLLRQRAELMKRIGTIKQTLSGLADLFGDAVLDDRLLQILERKTVRHSGFTHACRTVLMNSAGPLSARQVRDQIRKKFPGLVERHKDPLASVTTVLSRLAQYSEARCSIVGPGRRVWQWSAESASSRTLVEERTSSVEAPMQ
jgi:chorismate mutase